MKLIKIKYRHGFKYMPIAAGSTVCILSEIIFRNIIHLARHSTLFIGGARTYEKMKNQYVTLLYKDCYNN